MQFNLKDLNLEEEHAFSDDISLNNEMSFELNEISSKLTG